MTRKEYNELTEPQIELYNLVQALRKEYWEVDLLKTQIADILTKRGYAKSSQTLYHKIARIKGI